MLVCEYQEAIGSAVENEITVGKSGSASPIKPSDENFLQKSSRKVISASAVSIVIL